MRIPKRLFTFSLSNFSPQLVSPLLSCRISFAFGISAKPSRPFPNIASPGSFSLLNLMISCALSFLNHFFYLFVWIDLFDFIVKLF